MIVFGVWQACVHIQVSLYTDQYVFGCYFICKLLFLHLSNRNVSNNTHSLQLLWGFTEVKCTLLLWKNKVLPDFGSCISFQISCLGRDDPSVNLYVMWVRVAKVIPHCHPPHLKSYHWSLLWIKSLCYQKVTLKRQVCLLHSNHPWISV